MSLQGRINFRVNPGNHIHGQIKVPGDKSISHRALMLGAIADGETIIKGFLQGQDTLDTMTNTEPGIVFSSHVWF